jgi:hypothetical protein
MMREQTLLKLSLPTGTRMYASRLRELLARDCDLPPEFFHRNGNGGTLQGSPTIRTVGGKGWVGVLGDGNLGEKLVEMATIPALRSVQKEIGAVVPIRLEQHLPQIEKLETIAMYWVRELVVKRRSQKLREAEPEMLAELVVMNGLKRTSEYFGLDVSLLETDCLFRVEEVIRPRGLRICTTSGETNEYATLMDVKFSLNRKLLGFWFAGNLTSRGYGRIGRDLNSLRNGGKERESIK